MLTLNKKIIIATAIGCILAANTIWLLGLGAATPVLPALQQYPQLTMHYYLGAVTAILAVLTAFVTVKVGCRTWRLDKYRYMVVMAIPVMGYLAMLLLFAQWGVKSSLFALLPSVLALVVAHHQQRAKHC